MRVTPILALCFVGCATAPPAEQDSSATEVVKRTLGSRETLELTRYTVLFTDTLAAPPERSWPALLAAGNDLGLVIQAADSGAGMVVFYLPASSTHIAGDPPSKWLDCGRAPGGVPRTATYQITLNLTAVLERDQQGSRVRTSLVANARDRGMGAAAVACTSAGTLEKRLVRLAGARLQSND